MSTEYDCSSLSQCQFLYSPGPVHSFLAMGSFPPHLGAPLIPELPFQSKNLIMSVHYNSSLVLKGIQNKIHLITMATQSFWELNSTNLSIFCQKFHLLAKIISPNTFPTPNHLPVPKCALVSKFVGPGSWFFWLSFPLLSNQLNHTHLG